MKKILSQKSICIQCGRNEKKQCPDCGKPLCGFCGSKKPNIGLGKNPIYQKGICQDCVQKKPVNTAVNGRILAVTGLLELLEHIRSNLITDQYDVDINNLEKDFISFPDNSYPRKNKKY